MSPFEYDACVIGTGRVGLPLALSLTGAGLRVLGVERNVRLIDSINSGVMPFREPGYQDLITSKQLHVEPGYERVRDCRAIIITVGTPLFNHIETDLRQIESVLESVHSHLRAGQLICLRSTVTPGTTLYVKRWIESHTALVIGQEIGLVTCPERIAEGKAKRELRELPQIVGAEDELSIAKAKALFSPLVREILFTNYVSAELVKLFNNIARYVDFALANQFALLADGFGADIYKIRDLANYKYERSRLATPGLTAGTCLRKDFGMINEWSPYPDLLLSAWKMNEYMPAFLVRHMVERTDLYQKHVAILGYTFKGNTDDMRDSLAPKLRRYLARELPCEIRVSDHHLPDPLYDEQGECLRNWPAADAVVGTDCIFVATNHDGYDKILKKVAVENPAVWVADIWNMGRIDKIFYRAGDLVRRAEEETGRT